MELVDVPFFTFGTLCASLSALECLGICLSCLSSIYTIYTQPAGRALTTRSLHTNITTTSTIFLRSLQISSWNRHIGIRAKLNPEP